MIKLEIKTRGIVHFKSAGVKGNCDAMVSCRVRCDLRRDAWAQSDIGQGYMKSVSQSKRGMYVDRVETKLEVSLPMSLTQFCAGID